MPQEPYPLTNAHWKTEWAQGHLDDLREAVSTFCADSHTITPEDEPERDQIRYRVYTKQPHVSVYLICGDFLQCLRTSLDQAVWSLINHRTGVDSDDSEFPIFEKPLNSETLRKFNKKTVGLSDSAIAYIKSIQPYNRPAGLPLSTDPLWRIHELNRIDKHRRISVLPQIAFGARHHFGAGPGVADFTEMCSERTDYGFDVICRGSYKHLKPEITSLVLFGEEKSGIILNIDDMAQLHNFVTDEVLVALASRAN